MKGQVVVLKEELEKQKKDWATVRKNSDGIADKIFKTQNYLRNLSREEQGSSEKLARLEDDNNYLDRCLEEMQMIIERNQNEVQILQKENEGASYELSTREI